MQYEKKGVLRKDRVRGLDVHKLLNMQRKE